MGAVLIWSADSPSGSGRGVGRRRGPGRLFARTARAWGLGWLFALAPATAAAQDHGYDLSVRDVPVDRALEELVSLTGISLLYSSDIVLGRRTVCRIEGGSAEDLFRCIVAGAGLDFYRLSSGTYVVIESPRALPAYGALGGRIVDDVTGAPVPEALVETADGARRARTDAAGIFLLPGLLPGPHRLVVSQAGYALRTLGVTIGSSETLRREIRLDPEVLELDPIVVDGLDAVGEPSDKAAPDPFGRPLPADGDVAREARGGLGISRRPGFSDLSVQGSAPGEHLVRLDGIPIYDPVALGRARSAFSPLALDRIVVRKAGFGVEHGSLTGGVIDLEHAIEGREGRAGGAVLADPLSLSGSVSVPVRLGVAEGWWMASGRTSVWDVYREPSLDDALREWNQVDPILMRQQVGDGIRLTDGLRFDTHRHGSDVRFNDVHTAARIGFPGFRTLEASFYRGTNEIGTELFSSGTDPETGTFDRLMVTRDRYDWSNTAGRVAFDWLVGSRGAVRARAWGTQHRLDHAFGLADGLEVGYDPGTSSVDEIERRLRGLLDAEPREGEDNSMREVGLAVSGDLATGGGHFLGGGVEGVRLNSRVRLENGFLLPIESNVTGWRFSGFLRDRWTAGRHLTLEGGMRATIVDGGGVYAEPRVSARIDATAPGLGPWSLRLAGGIHRQYVEELEVSSVGPSALVPEVRFWVPADGSLEPSRSRHLALELAARPARSLSLQVEGYVKDLDRILAVDYGVLTAAHDGTVRRVAQEDFIGAAEGIAYGAGVRATWEEGRRRLRIGYDRSVSERTFPSRFGGDRQPTPWSEPHRLEVQGRLPVAGGLALEAQHGSVWGRTWGLRRAYYDFLTFHGTDGGPTVGRPADDPLPALHQLDIGVSWLGRVAGSLVEMRADVRNLVPDQILDQSLVRDEAPDGSTVFRRIDREMPGTAFILSLRLAP